MFQTLHCHTTASDGLLTHDQLLDICGRNNIGVVAFTDHDSLPDTAVVKNLLNRTKEPTKWVVGIEISSDKPTDFQDQFSPHIVGLFVNPFDKNLRNHCNLAKKARRQRMGHMVKKLRGLGFDITEKDCLKASKGESVGRPHIVQAIESKPGNIEIIEKLRKLMQRDSKKDENIKNKYELMMKKGKGSYPYELFLSDDSYISEVYVDYMYRIDLDNCVKLIRNAGGAAFFAHWFTEMEKCDETKIELLLKEGRIDGVETVYGFFDDMREEFIRQRKILKDLVDKYHKLESGGVDAHTREHLVDFSKDKWYAGMTVGMAEKIVKSGKVDKQWSSLK
jgi:predicted metal-dependent phosphoesterase TrpH